MAKKNTLKINTIMLYLLTFSNYFFSILTVPYQTRVLGPEIYGMLGFVLAMMIYFQLILDFGFTLSGTASISRVRDNKEQVSKIFESIIIGKFFLFFVCVVILFLLEASFTQFNEYKFLFWLSLIFTFVNSLLPDFLYRGMEVMKPITYRTIIVRLIFTLGIFLLVKKPDDYLWVPILYLLGAIIALIISIVDIKRRFKLNLVSLTYKEIESQIMESFPYFISRVASTVYGASNMIILGAKYSGQNILGYYTSADKIVTIVRMAASPIADSLYPYMVKNKDYNLVKKILLFITPIIGVGALVLAVYAEPICIFIFGEEYAYTAMPLRALIPVIIFVLPSYVLGFPVMTPLGIAKHANLSVVYGAVLQIILLFFLFIFDQVNILSICLITSITETFVFLYRLINVLIELNKDRRNIC